MSVSMIAAGLITILSCSMMFFIIRFISTNVLKKLKKEIFFYIKSYNRFMQEQQEQEELQEAFGEIAATKEESSLFVNTEGLAIPYIPKSQSMQKSDFFQDYMKIRNAFQYDSSMAVKKIQNQEKKEEERALYNTISRILDKLSFDNIYKIACVSPCRQTEILNDILEPTELKVLIQFVKEHNESCDCIEFYSYLKMKKKELDETIFVYTGQQASSDIKPEEGKVEICFDQDICEGFQIIQGNHMYDFGIRSSEIIL